MRIQHNIMAMNAYRNLGKNNGALSKNLEKLSSGYRINRAGDDAAGLAISEKMRAQISGLDQAQKNAQSGINLVQTAEGALTEVHDMLNRMVTLATQAANGTYTTSDQTKIQAEVNALTQEIDRIAANSNFNGQKLLNGDLDVTQSSVFSKDVDVTGKKAGVDLEFSAAKFTKASGTKTNFTFALAHTTTAANIKAAITAGGTITVKLNAKKDYTAEDIADMIAKMTTSAFVTTSASAKAAKASVTEALAGLVVTGNGVDGFDRATALGVTAATTAGGSGTAMTLQIGADAVETIDVAVEDMSASGLRINNLDLTSVDGANKAIDTIKSAIEKVSVTRGDLGAIQNRLEHTINNLGVMEENIQDAEANIRDTDIADEMMAYTKNNILIQSAQAMLAQANQVPQGVLQLMQ